MEDLLIFREGLQIRVKSGLQMGSLTGIFKNKMEDVEVLAGGRRSFLVRYRLKNIEYGVKEETIMKCVAKAVKGSAD